MEVDSLVSAIFLRPALLDKKDKNHHNRSVLDKLWNEVANELQSTPTAVRSKWKTLRDNFGLPWHPTPNQNLVTPKVNVGTSNPSTTTLASNPKPKSGDSRGEWRYFKSLYFLKDQFTCRKSSGNFSTTNDGSDLDDETEDEKRSNLEDIAEPCLHALLHIEKEEDYEILVFLKACCHTLGLSPLDKMGYHMGVLKLTTVHARQVKYYYLTGYSYPKKCTNFFIMKLM